jgi:hypothetical protein
MKKSLVMIGLAALAIFAVGALYAGTELPGEVMIDDCVAKKAAVKFDHTAHQERGECVACHHTQDAGLTADSGAEVQSCGACHNEPAEDTTPVCSQMSMSKNPFHKTCIGCHKESGAEAAPTKCDGCHPKAE